MPKSPNFHSNERIDKIDLDHAALFGRETINLDTKKLILDRQDRIVEGFKVELPDQDSFPGRVIIHGGIAFQRDGQLVFTEDQLDISRDITLEGANTNFYLEVEFLESDSDVDARAFWDPTVDQGTDISGDALPDGQEFFVNVATRKTPDWKIVHPVSTTGFQRETDPTSNRIPVCKLRTDANNKIKPAVNVGLTTSPASSVLLQTISPGAISFYVQDPTLFQTGDSITIGTEAAKIINSVNFETGVITLTGTTASGHDAGEIVKVTGGTPLQFIDDSKIGRYRRYYEANVIDYRDKLFQGDEVHGKTLASSHANFLSATTPYSDQNLRSLKDYIDFLSAQVEEMKWGYKDPNLSMTDSKRTPPGLPASTPTNFPTKPRYYDRTPGVACSRTPTITIGTGIDSFGDLNGTNQTVFTAAIAAIATTGGTIYVKRGSYYLLGNVIFNMSAGTYTTIVFEDGALVYCAAGNIVVNTTGSITFKNLKLSGFGAYTTGISVETPSPGNFIMEDCELYECTFDVKDVALPVSSHFVRCQFLANTAAMASLPLVRTLPNAGAVISGVFEHCIFVHISAAFLSGSCVYIDPINSTQMSLTTFNCCFFYSLGFNSAAVDLGSFSSVIDFNSCEFLMGLTLYHIKAGGGGSIRSVNCVGGDASGHFIGTSLYNVLIENYRNANSVSWSTVALTDCNNINIQGLEVRNNSGVSLSNALISIAVTAGQTSSNIKIHGNYLQSDFGIGLYSTTGISAVIGAGSTMKDLSILDNIIDDFETGIYLISTAATGTFSHPLINDNKIDGNTGAGTSNSKMGIYIPADDSTTKVYGLNTTGNQIININGTGVAVGAGAGNVGIHATALRGAVICSNTIRIITSPTGQEATGIKSSGFSGEINSNLVNGVYGGIVGVGINIGYQPASTSINWNVCNNVLDSINVTDNAPTRHFGILIRGTHTNLNVDGNILKNWAYSGTTAPTVEILIGSDTVITTQLNIKIRNNTCMLNDAAKSTGTFIQLLFATLKNCSVEHNTIDCGTGANGGGGISLVGTTLVNCHVNHNNLQGLKNGPAIYLVCTAQSDGIQVCHNDIQDSTSSGMSGQGIYLNGPFYNSVVDGNICLFHSASSSSSNIECSGSVLAVVNNNNLLIPSGSVSNNILMAGADSGYVIASNNCRGISTAANIDTTLATGAKNGQVIGNNVTIAVTVRGGDQSTHNFVTGA